ncbi:hypothetical protein JCM19046_4151 [Bacillus sp. JCM 19046]|nr:hypothetical protein JCM19045_3476 [Bacillus sp. JCM 19045]GAF19496.1 hypothetical protein JCM19046_4151 [Bacillus sp. JCM 19046]
MSIVLFCDRCGNPEKLKEIHIIQMTKIDTSFSCRTCKKDHFIPLNLRVEVLLLANQMKEVRK